MFAWIALGSLIWMLVAGAVVVAIGLVSRIQWEGQAGTSSQAGAKETAGENASGAEAVEANEIPSPVPTKPLHILVVDDDPNLRDLLRTSFEIADIEVEEAESAGEAVKAMALQKPDVIVLDVNMPIVDGLTFCRGLKSDPTSRHIPVVLLTGDAISDVSAKEAGADAFLRKPFSPLALLKLVERLGATAAKGAPSSLVEGPANQQLLLYAQDFRRLLELERAQRALLQDAYRETVVTLARALESKDGATGAHSERVRRYGTELAQTIDESLLSEPSLEYGFILHDIGKIGIPDSVLAKRAPLTDSERRLLETHTVLGEQMVGDAALLRGQGVRVVRSHHERWDGKGYPDGLGGEEIPLAARIFAVADTLDAITSDRPYRRAGRWEDAVAEIVAQAGSQFDPSIVEGFRDREEALRRVYYEFNTN